VNPSNRLGGQECDAKNPASHSSGTGLIMYWVGDETGG